MYHSKCTTTLVAMVIVNIIAGSSAAYFTSPDFITDIMTDYKHYCPYVYTCFNESNANDTYTTLQDIFDCCRKCICDSDCGTECCPDVIRDLSKSDELIDAFLQQPCTAAIYTGNNSMWQEDVYYRMFAHCPIDYHDKTTVNKCERPYNEFNFFSEPIADFMPVSTGRVSETYKNRHCAICRGVDTETLISWTMALMCEEKVTYELTSFTDIPGFLHTQQDCGVYFSPQGGALVAETCSDNVIEHCNVTGLWQEYDPFIEIACLSYSSIYDADFFLPEKIFFRNVHCAMCNVGPSKRLGKCFVDYKGPPHVLPFTSLLQFSQNDAPLHVPNQPLVQCPTDNVYVHPLDRCEPVFCAHGLKSKSWNIFECLPQAVKIDFLHINFRLTFNGAPDMDFSMEDLHDQFTSFVDNTINQVHGEHVTLVHSAMDAVLNDTFHNVVLRLLSIHQQNMVINENSIWMNTNYLVFRIAFEILNVTSNRHVLIKLENAFATGTVAKVLGVRFSVRSKAEMYSVGRISNIVPRILIENSSAIQDLNLSSYVQDAIFHAFENWSLEKGIIPFVLSEQKSQYNPFLLGPDLYNIELWPNPLCSRVHLKTDDPLYNYVYSLLKQDVEIVHDAKDRGLYICTSDLTTENISFILDDEYPILNTTYDIISSWLTFMCILLSISALCLTLLVYVTLPQLRTWPNMNNIFLTLTLFVFHVCYLISQSRVFLPDSCGCVVSVMVLHWSLLSYIFWMTVSILHVTRMFSPKPRLSSSFNLKKQFLRYSLGVMIGAALFVCVNVGFSLGRSDNRNFGYGGSICYITGHDMVIYTVGIPIGVAIVTNVVMFTYCVFRYCRLPHISVGTDQTVQKFKVLTKIFIITGATWSFGYLYEFTRIPAFAYIFIVLNAGQGMLVFVCFILNKRVLNMIKTKFYVGKRLYTDTTKTMSVR